MTECQVCGNKEARYRCPACDKRTCSLPCVRLHKQQDECTGSRHSRPLPKSRIDPLADAAFLDSHPEFSSSSCGGGGGGGERQRKMERLVGECAKRGIELLLMPAVFKKAVENKSMVGGDGRIVWTVRVNDKIIQLREDDDICACLKNDNIEVKCERPVRWKPVNPGDTLNTVLKGETVVEFPELRPIGE